MIIHDVPTRQYKCCFPIAIQLLKKTQMQIKANNDYAITCVVLVIQMAFIGKVGEWSIINDLPPLEGFVNGNNLTIIGNTLTLYC